MEGERQQAGQAPPKPRAKKPYLKKVALEMEERQKPGVPSLRVWIT